MAYDLTRLKFHGGDVVISDFVEIRRPYLVSIGNHAAIDSFVSIATGAEIGDYVHISPHVPVIGGRPACCAWGTPPTLPPGAASFAVLTNFSGTG
jgi:hypothetical protein